MTAATEVGPSSKELVLVANLLARPDLLTAVSLNPGKLHDPTARAVLKVLTAEGPAFAAPGPMITALQELPDLTDINVLEQIFVAQPEPADVELSQLINLKGAVEKNHIDRVFIADVEREMDYIQRGGSPEGVAERLERAIHRYSSSKIERDHTAGGILGRLKQTPPKVRWKVGIPDLDYAFPGIGPDGQPAYGMLAQKEVTVLVGGYKSGKSREQLNWVYRLLDQGANVALVVLEDDEGSFATKLMAAKFRVRKHILERYIFGGVGFLGEDGKELAGRCQEAVDWFNSVSGRLRIYDASTRLDIFRFESLLELLAIDKALHGTTHVFIDYIQALGGEYKEMAGYAFGFRAFAAKHDVGLIELSQVSNETLKFGSGYGQLAAKGAGEFGQAAHVGLEIYQDPAVGDKEFALKLKIARDAPKMSVFVQYDVTTGTALRYYGTPEYIDLDADQPKGNAKKGGPRR